MESWVLGKKSDDVVHNEVLQRQSVEKKMRICSRSIFFFWKAFCMYTTCCTVIVIRSCRVVLRHIYNIVLYFEHNVLFKHGGYLTFSVLLFYVLLAVHLGVIFVNNQLDAQFYFTCVYFYSLHVSGSHVPIIRRINCINTTSGICHSV